MSLTGEIKVLCTRPIEDWLIEEAAENKIKITVQPFITTVSIDTIEVIEEIDTSLLQCATVVFTSMNAVEAVAAQLHDQTPDWQIYCMGTTTKKLVKQYFGEELLAGTAGNADDLATLILEDDLASEVIFFCGDQRLTDLPKKLEENDVAVNEIVVYQTIELPQQIKENYHGILFFSPTAVNSFFKKNIVNPGLVFFAIGNTTANAIRKKTNNKLIVSKSPGKESLVETMINYFNP